MRLLGALLVGFALREIFEMALPKARPVVARRLPHVTYRVPSGVVLFGNHFDHPRD